ncbi:hypothetical protein E8E12_008524 [Didymella heteroderae]|uniref:Uncharacterized protein n=1 Tax=Didymella heteroderae TaxID=1769908 RepID=A0A9P4WV00_9PLEO|nr:hypothetical protein E8E12_008524 [Didymella heteroderae]
MSRPTTPEPKTGPNDIEPPSTPGADITPKRDLPPRTPGAPSTPVGTMRFQRKTPIPSTPGGHRRMASIPRTPGSSVQPCSSSPTSFTSIKVHTAKCSECDQRNIETMLRCPGCTFQLCKPCRDRRETAGRSLAHGNMMTPRIATPGTGGSVVRRKPVSSVKKNESQEAGKYAQQEVMKSDRKAEIVTEEKIEVKEPEATKRMAKPGPKPKAKAKSKTRESTPDDSSDDDFAPDPGSPTASKRRRTLTSRTDSPADMPSPFLMASSAKGVRIPDKVLGDMTTDELLAHHGVNTVQSPYEAHLLSRREPVVSDPVIEIPEVVKRSFKPRPTAEEIQQNIQDKVREKMGLGRWTEEDGGKE